MKKPSSLAQQVQQAQREFERWTPERKASVRLEGSSDLITKFRHDVEVRSTQKSNNGKR
jgi:hypothetical protein